MKTLTRKKLENYIKNRKAIPLALLEEGSDADDYYLCPTCYAPITTHDALEDSSGYCEACGQRLRGRKREEAWFTERLKALISSGRLKIQKDARTEFAAMAAMAGFTGTFHCILDGKTEFQIPYLEEETGGTGHEAKLWSIALVVMHPGMFGLSQETANNILDIIYEDED